MSYILIILIGYLIGCINGAQIVGKIKHIDIKNSGVKNAGASNTTLVLGWKYGLIVLLIDVLKAVIPILILQSMTNNYSLIYLLGAFIILGHNYPMTMKFDGGKGTASVIGMVFAINWKLAIVLLVILLFVSLMTDYLVMGVVIYYIMFTTATHIEYGSIPTAIVIGLTIISALKHRENFTRIKYGLEPTIWSAFKKKA